MHVFAKSKENLIASIKDKCSSILRSSSLEYLYDNAKNNYYNEHNEEIVTLTFKNMYTKDSAEKTKDILHFGYWEEPVIYYNVTNDTWDFAVYVESDKDDDSKFVMSKDLTQQTLQTLDDTVFDIITVRIKDEENLKKYTKKFPLNSYCKIKDNFYRVVKVPEIKDFTVVEMEVEKIDPYTGKTKKDIKTVGTSTSCYYNCDEAKTVTVNDILEVAKKYYKGMLDAHQESNTKNEARFNQIDKDIERLLNEKQQLKKHIDKYYNELDEFKNNQDKEIANITKILNYE